MPNPEMTMPAEELRAAVSVAEMARMVGLSRARFYELLRRGVFAQPVYAPSTRRPIYPADLQRRNLDVRRDQIGMNGEFVLFYERAAPAAAPPSEPRSRPLRTEVPEGLVARLRALGVDDATPQSVTQAVSACYPRGVGAVEPSEVLRRVFRHMRRPRTA